jgi:hypothetical protein
MFPPFHNSGDSNDLARVECSRNEKDVVAAKEMVATGPDPSPAITSAINPGELTFEEGQSSQQPCAFQEICLTCDARYCWWNGSPHGCLQLHNAQVRPSRPHHSFFLDFLTLRPALAPSSARVSSPLHRPSSNQSGRLAHP